MLNKIVFEKLFGVFDYEINLKEGGVTILTGPNGFGKSTILKSINAFYLFDITFFSKLDFKKISFFSSNFKKPICIEKENTNIIIDEIKINIKLLEEEMQKKSRKRINEDNWIDRRLGRIISKNEIIEFFFENNEEKNNFSKIDIGKLKDKFKKYSGDTKFIKEQRLLKEETIELFEKQTINVIEELPDQFKNKMNQVSSKYSSEANRLDSSYPNRLFKTEKGITKDEYEMSLESMNKKFEKLNKYNISDIKRLGEQVEFLEEHSKALKIYFDDFEKKYKVFEDFIEQLDLFTDIINSRLNFKEIRISREDGIVVYKSNNLKKNERLSLEQLSSGEKQEIILFYELIFESEKNIHLLIDEPEISLHIEWQLKFMDDLLRIAEKKKFKVTVATHSPQIINNHWDIQIDLGEMYGN
ncbi:hypothetical protein CA839_07860 [Fusobacterium polymorphum]|uniref:Endonuclease GajA/Old nuclease/RecF-like AAA domain-containing protein n=1 Tax=Fusobacterium nucleatum subsp. polymorphum TaxID=76857 RepID=A0A246EGT2_FUSNP|nr:AAA family ATPase [Fusobacterium polymorphum]OWP25820.1 hypothetical protein CA839_07860 [Fusobacterium polymorphum]